jgi:START domain
MGRDPLQDQWVVRASVILPIPSDVVLYYICDHGKRSAWDLQFPISSHIATFDENTELVHWKSSEFMRPWSSCYGGLVVLVLLVASLASSGVVLVVLALILWQSEHLYQSIASPRDVVVLRQVLRKQQENERVPAVITILEKSIVNERVPPRQGVVRAIQRLGGWRLEPLENGHTLVTFTSDLDGQGWWLSEQKRLVLIQRLELLSLLLEYVHQSHVLVATLGVEQEYEQEESDTEAIGTPTTRDDASLDVSSSRVLSRDGASSHWIAQAHR